MKANRVSVGLVVLITIWWEIHAFGATTPRVAGQWPGIPRSQAGDLSVQGDTLFARMFGGVAEIDVSNPAKMRRVGMLGSAYRRVTPAGGNYVFEYYIGPLRLLDMTDRAAPVEVSRIDGNFVSVAVAWPFVYTTSGDRERLETYDYSDPAHPIAVEGATVAGYWGSLKVQGDILAGLTTPGTFAAFDISNRTNLVQRGSYSGVYAYGTFDVAGRYAYVTDTTDLMILDMQNNAQEVGRAPSGGLFDSVVDIVAFPNVVWVSRANSGVQIFDVTDPTTPNVIGGWGGLGATSHARRGNDVFLASYPNISAFDATNPAAPKLKGLIAAGVYYGSIAVANNVGYLGAHNETSHVLDLSDPARPFSVRTFEPAYSLDLSGDKLFLIATNYHLKVFDISDSARPALWSESSNLQNGFPVVADGLRAYATFDQNVRVINFSDTQSPRIEGEVKLNIPQVPVGRMIRDGTNLLASARYVNGYLSIVNISDPAHPVVSATITNTVCDNIAASGNTVYLQTDNNIAIWDISYPGTPILRGTINVGFFNTLAVGGNRLLVLVNNQLDIYDISSPFSPTLIGSVKSLPINTASMIAIGDVAYIAGGESGLLTVQLAGELPANPTLTVFNEGEMHRVRWSSDYDGYILQTAPTINGPWSAEAPGYSPFTFFNEATFANHTNRFYRLQK